RTSALVPLMCPPSDQRTITIRVSAHGQAVSRRTPTGEGSAPASVVAPKHCNLTIEDAAQLRPLWVNRVAAHTANGSSSPQADSRACSSCANRRPLGVTRHPTAMGHVEVQRTQGLNALHVAAVQGHQKFGKTRGDDYRREQLVARGLQAS